MESILKNTLGALTVIVLSGCLESGGGSGGSGGGAPALAPGGPSQPVSGVPQTITLKRGFDFECFALARDIWCRTRGGHSPDARLGIVSATFAIQVEDLNSSITDFRTWDDTLCWESQVAQRPYARSAGTATYCIGEATLSPTYTLFPLIYNSPFYTPANHDSTDVAYAAQPFTGADMTLEWFENQTQFTPAIVTDGRTVADSVTLNCTLDAGILTCPAFTLDTN